MIELNHGSGQTLVKLAKTFLSLKSSLELTNFSMFGYFKPVLTLIACLNLRVENSGKSLRLKWGYDIVISHCKILTYHFHSHNHIVNVNDIIGKHIIHIVKAIKA